MNIRQYQVDAFTTKVFGGNPAAVCPLDAWLDDEFLQAIAAENNLSETAFFVRTKEGFHLRWFTPVAEVKLCGHATLATARVIFNHLGYSAPKISFTTLSGELLVKRSGASLEMDFPSTPATPCITPKILHSALGQQPIEALTADDYLAVFDDEDIVRNMKPDMNELALLDLRGVIITARGKSVDFVSRFFAPKYGIPEDPVTGSAHCTLTPYWSTKLGKTTLNARQISQRGGDIRCELKGERVKLTGHAITFMEAEIFV